MTLNNQPLRLFNLGNLTVSDALLVAGIDVRSLQGRPGLGIAITINGNKKFIPGSLGQSGNIHVNGVSATFTDLLYEGDLITVEKGHDGQTPSPKLYELLTLPPVYTMMINNQPCTVAPHVTVNGNPAAAETSLVDRDIVICRPPATLEEVLRGLGIPTEPEEHCYIINGIERTFRHWPDYKLNGQKAVLSTPIQNKDSILVPPMALPTLAQLLGLDETAVECYTVTFNETPCSIPIRRYSISISGQSAKPSDIVQPNCYIEYSCYEAKPMVSDVLLAAEFVPRDLPPASRIEIFLNGQSAEYTSPIKNGDQLTIRIADIFAQNTFK